MRASLGKTNKAVVYRDLATSFGCKSSFSNHYPIHQIGGHLVFCLCEQGILFILLGTELIQRTDSPNFTAMLNLKEIMES